MSGHRHVTYAQRLAAAEVLAAGGDVRAAATAADVSVAAVYRWLKSDAEFRHALDGLTLMR